MLNVIMLNAIMLLAMSRIIELNGIMHNAIMLLAMPSIIALKVIMLNVLLSIILLCATTQFCRMSFLSMLLCKMSWRQSDGSYLLNYEKEVA
jgi:hypothetical protein